MKHMTPKEAHAYRLAHPEAVLIDCRTEMEFFYVGHPLGATHVVWQEAPNWHVNQAFASEVLRETKSTQRPVLLICRSGSRTLDAAAALEQAGFTDVINVLHGFEGDLDPAQHRNSINGWRHDGLPWEQM